MWRGDTIWLHAVTLRFGCSRKKKVLCGEVTPSGYMLLHTPREHGRGDGVAVAQKSSIVITLERVVCNFLNPLRLWVKPTLVASN